MYLKRQFAHVDIQLTMDEWRMLVAILRLIQQHPEIVDQDEMDFVSAFFFAQ